MDFAPIKLKHAFKPRLWGGNILKSHFSLPEDANGIGECWALADLPDEESVIDGGRFDGRNLHWFLEVHGESFGFNQQQCQNTFGLLNKYLGAGDILSLQVHPDAPVCRKYNLSGPKVKCWYVIDAADDAYIYNGLIDGVVKDDMKAALADGSVESLLLKRKVKKGDFFFVPAGTLHALGAGILVAEVGTPSRAAFRLYDWARKDDSGNGRQLNIDEALESTYFEDSIIDEDSQPAFIHGTLQTFTESLGETRVLVENPYFSVAELTSSAGTKKFKTPVPFAILPVSGSATIYNEMCTEETVEIKMGSGIIFPASQHGVIEFNDDCCLLICTLGPIDINDNVS